MKKSVLRNFAKSTGKQPVPEFFLIKLPPTSLKKETLAQVFSCEFCEIYKNTLFTEHLWTPGFVDGKNSLKTLKL